MLHHKRFTINRGLARDRDKVLAACGAILLLSACAPGTAGIEDSGGPLEVACYRGQILPAERHGDRLFVDGDLEVTNVERDCGDGVALSEQGRRAPSTPGLVWSSAVYGVVWPGGVVPYQIGASFSASERNAIETAMADWHAAAPGVLFRDRISSDPSWVKFVKDTRCSSGYGLIPGERTIRLTAGCTRNFSVHHEIGHALGLQHEHTRSDRDNYVTVSGFGQNYLIDSGADMFDYDFDSVMHYPLSANISLAPGVTLPTGVTVGQRNHLSATDVASMRAMYPQSTVQRILFAPTGEQRLCRLTGREADINTEFDRDSAAPRFSGSGAFIDTDSLIEGDFMVSCTARSLFWSRDYDYPNTTFTESISAADAADIQTYEAQATVRVLNAGLIAIIG